MTSLTEDMEGMQGENQIQDFFEKCVCFDLSVRQKRTERVFDMTAFTNTREAPGLRRPRFKQALEQRELSALPNVVAALLSLIFTSNMTCKSRLHLQPSFALKDWLIAATELRRKRRGDFKLHKFRGGRTCDVRQR